MFSRFRRLNNGAMGNDLTYNQSMLLCVRKAIKEAVESGAQSATLSSVGGSESYTRLSLAALREMEKDCERKVAAEGGPMRRVAPDFGRAG